MAEDQDRAARIAELKAQHPRLTWAEIGRRVGVTERAATAWQRTGSLKPENAEALAAVFGVDFDYIWRGQQPETPDPFASNGSVASEDQVDEVAVEFRGHVSDLVSDLAEIKAKLNETRSEQDRISALIEQQNKLLERQERILERIEDATVRQSRAAHRMEEAADAWRAATERQLPPNRTSPPASRTRS